MSDVFVFEPFANVGEVVGILTTEGSWIYRVISYAEPLPPSEEGMIKDFGAISNNETKEDQAVSLIKMRSNELGQFRFEVLDNISEIGAAERVGEISIQRDNRMGDSADEAERPDDEDDRVLRL